MPTPDFDTLEAVEDQPSPDFETLRPHVEESQSLLSRAKGFAADLFRKPPEISTEAPPFIPGPFSPPVELQTPPGGSLEESGANRSMYEDALFSLRYSPAGMKFFGRPNLEREVQREMGLGEPSPSEVIQAAAPIALGAEVVKGVPATIAGVKYTYDQIAAIPGQWKALQEAKRSGDPEAIRRARIELGLSVAGAATIPAAAMSIRPELNPSRATAKLLREGVEQFQPSPEGTDRSAALAVAEGPALIREEPRVARPPEGAVTPETQPTGRTAEEQSALQREVFGESTPEETTDASKDQKTAEVHGNVREQPVEGQGEVPAKEGGEGVQPPVPAEETKPARSVEVKNPLGEEAGGILGMSGDQFYETADKWTKGSMAGEKMPPQRRASKAALENPNLAAWEKAHAEANAQAKAIRDEIKSKPETMMARQKEMMGAGQKAQFFAEGVKAIKGQNVDKFVPIEQRPPEDRAKPEAPKPAPGASEVVATKVTEQAPPTPQAAPAAAATEPKFKSKMFQGRGASLEDVYGPEAVKEGRAAPLFGKAEYFSPTKEGAAEYGKVTEHDVELKNPFVLDSDEKWFGLLKDADAPHLNNMGKLFYTEPKKVPAAGEKVQAYLRSKGYDGIVVKLSHDSDLTRRLSNMVGDDQVVRFQGKENKISGDTKWSSATDEPASIGAGIRKAMEGGRGGETGAINLGPIQELFDAVGPKVREAIAAVKDLAKESVETPKMNDLRRSVLNWSAKMQRSFGEASDAQKEIKAKVPNAVRREGITNWIQAGGDQAVLKQRAATTSDPKLRKGYEAALTLTPEELQVANDVKSAFDALGNRGNSFGVINSFVDNYVTQIWDMGKSKPAMGSARTLKDRFRFSKARTFDTFFDGEQAGFAPKTKDISKLLPVYLHEMNSVIAARQMVKQMSTGLASDGRPLVVPRGGGKSITGPKGDATVITPRAVKGADTLDYKVLEGQPALHDWTWATKDSADNPVFLKSDLALHPEAYVRLKNILGKSAIKEWYETPTTRTAAIPKLIVKGLDVVNQESKRTMLGLLAPFHQVQEGTHAVGHRVFPSPIIRGGASAGAPEALTIPKIDLVNNREQMDAARHGLMLMPDRASANQFMEGFRPSGLISKIPGVGAVADWYSNYLFHEFIPGLKMKTYERIFARNQEVYAKQIVTGEVFPEDVKILSAEQTNAAYGHLNYSDLGRNPTIQHIAQFFGLAPDFLEARARFVGQTIKGIGGAKAGREQLLALGTLAIAQGALAYTLAKLTDSEWYPKRPFEVRHGNRTYTMRSVPEDLVRLATDTRAFVHNRMSLMGKAALQYLTGVDWRGRKTTAWETTKELATQPIPLTARGFLGIGNTSLKWWEQLAGAVGLKISTYSAQNDVYKLAQDFKKNSKSAKLRNEYERERHTTNPDSDYKPLREALLNNQEGTAQQEYAKLLRTKSPDLIQRTFESERPFTGSRDAESTFFDSLNEHDKAIYRRAVKERRKLLEMFESLKKPEEAAPE